MDDFDGADAAVELEPWESHGPSDFEGLEPALRVRHMYLNACGMPFCSFYFRCFLELFFSPYCLALLFLTTAISFVYTHFNLENAN